MIPPTHGVGPRPAGTFRGVRGHPLDGASTTAVTVRLPTTSPGTGPMGGSGVIIPARCSVQGRPATTFGGPRTMVDFLLRRDEEGQTLAEYALILALIA